MPVVPVPVPILLELARASTVPVLKALATIYLPVPVRYYYGIPLRYSCTAVPVLPVDLLGLVPIVRLLPPPLLDVLDLGSSRLDLHVASPLHAARSG